MVCLGFEPGAAGWKARTNPLSYGGTPCFIMLIYNLLRKKLSNYIFKTCPIKGVRIIKDLSQSLLRLLIFLFNVFQRSWLFRWECEFNFETMNFRVSGIVYSSLLKLFSNQGRLTLAEHLKNWMKTLNLLNVYKFKNGFSGFENKIVSKRCSLSSI